MYKQNKTILIIGVILIAVLIFAFVIRNNNLPNQPGQPNQINQGDHVFGLADAPVKIMIYSDFECSFCAKFADTIKQVEQEFKDKVVITYRHYPLGGHPQANSAALASECAAEQDKFWEMHDKLFADNLAGRMGIDQFKIDAVDLGLDANQFNQCLDSAKYQDKIDRQMSQGKQAGVTGTPTSIINGNIYPGAYPFEDFATTDNQPAKGLKSIISDLLK
jgi:protein-disulfide isomerase